jgi:hypothetical protein
MATALAQSLWSLESFALPNVRVGLLLSRCCGGDLLKLLGSGCSCAGWSATAVGISGERQRALILYVALASIPWQVQGLR